MTELLTADKIAALVSQTKAGEGDGGGAGPGARRGHRLRTVDFSRPTKFNSDQQRRIMRAMETFCQTAVTRLSTELRTQVELEVLNTLQLTWSAAQAQLPVGSLSVLVEVAPINTRMMMTAEQSFVLTCLECLLGGTPEAAPRERRMSEIDWSLTRRLFESVVTQLSLVFSELAGLSLSAGEIDLSDNNQVASVSEPTFVVLIECRMAEQAFALALLIPWIAVEPVIAQISGAETAGGEDTAVVLPAIERAMSAVPVTLRAEVAETELAVAEILALAPGSVVKFRARADDGVSLFAEQIKLAVAQPGAEGGRRAVQIGQLTEGER